MERGSVVFSKWQNALNGTSLAIAELLVPAEPAPVLAVFPDSAFEGGARMVDAGVYCADVVSAFDPAEAEAEAENEVAAPAPLAPEEAFETM